MGVPAVVNLRSPREIALMRRAGLVVWGAHEIAAAMVRPGVSTGEIDAAVEAYFLKCGAVPLFKGVPGKVPFPAVCCISVNDEVVHGKKSLLSKMPGETWRQFAGVRTLFAYQYAHPGKKLLFMGAEIGQWIEWNAESSLDWHLLQWPDHQGVQKLVDDLNRLYKSEPALHRVDFHWSGFEWLALNDSENSVIAFARRQESGVHDVVCACNFTPLPRHNYRIGVSKPGVYREILNTDSAHYGGSNLGNQGLVSTVAATWGGKPYHIELTLPPMSAIYLRHEEPAKK